MKTKSILSRFKINSVTVMYNILFLFYHFYFFQNAKLSIVIIRNIKHLITLAQQQQWHSPKS